MILNEFKNLDIPKEYNLEFKGDHNICLKYKDDVIAVFNQHTPKENIIQEIRNNQASLEATVGPQELEDF